MCAADAQAVAPASLCIHAGRLAEVCEHRRQYDAEPRDNCPAAEPDAPPFAHLWLLSQLIRELARAPALCWFTNSPLEELIY